MAIITIRLILVSAIHGNAVQHTITFFFAMVLALLQFNWIQPFIANFWLVIFVVKFVGEALKDYQIVPHVGFLISF